MREFAPYTMRLTFPSKRGEMAVLVGPVGQEEERLSLRDYWWIITNRLRLIAVCFCGTILTTALLLVLRPHLYGRSDATHRAEATGCWIGTRRRWSSSCQMNTISIRRNMNS